MVMLCFVTVNCFSVTVHSLHVVMGKQFGGIVIFGVRVFIVTLTVTFVTLVITSVTFGNFSCNWCNFCQC